MSSMLQSHIYFVACAGVHNFVAHCYIVACNCAARASVDDCIACYNVAQCYYNIASTGVDKPSLHWLFSHGHWSAIPAVAELFYCEIRRTLQPSQVIAPKWNPDDGALHTLHDIDLKSTFSFLSSSQPVKHNDITFEPLTTMWCNEFINKLLN